MKHIVFIVGSYYPYFSAVGTCCFNIAEEMTKENKVTVICMKSRVGQSKVEEYHGQTIIRVSHKWWNVRLRFEEKINNENGVLKKWYQLLFNGVRVKEYLRAIFSRVNIKKALVNAYLNALKNIKEPIDAVIPLCFPMEAVVAGMKYKIKLPVVKLIPYLFDRFVESKELHRFDILVKLKMNRHLAIEKVMLELSDTIMAMNSLRRHFEEFFPDVKKIQFVEHPLIERKINFENHKMQTVNAKDSCVLVFTGALLKGYVVPDYMLNLLFRIREKLKYVIHLYISGNCENTIKNYRRLMPNNIVNYGYVKKATALQALANSNILINIAEISGIQVSSKIFEYMSVGKPIVHFYSAADDVNVKILEDYPLSLCLKQDDNLLQENAEKFVRFCLENRDKVLDFAKVEKIYYYATPKFITDQILTTINKEEQNCSDDSSANVRQQCI